MPNTKYCKSDEGFTIFVDDQNYLWRENPSTELEIYPEKFINYNPDVLPQIIARFVAIHHNKPFKLTIDNDSYKLEIDGRETIIKSENLEVEIRFGAQEKEESISVAVRKGNNIYHFRYFRDNHYYTYQILSDPVGVLDSIKKDISE